MTVAAAPRTRLRISEVFGPTFQGEGPSMGRRCSFVRLGGCNLHCVWCDTPYTWDWTGQNGRQYDPNKELHWSDADALWQDLTARGADMVVISGGEPLLQQGAGLTDLLTRAVDAGWRVEVETAGTVAPSDETAALVTQFNVSPKLGHSGNERSRRYVPHAIDALAATGKAVWKFVARDSHDLDETAELVAAHGLTPVWIMPEGTEASVINQRARDLSDDVLQRGWNLSTRLHVLLYGDRRGV